MSLTPFTPVVADAAAVGVGAVCGALCRYQIGKMATERISKNPRLNHLTGWHTAGINVLGSFTLGGIFGSPLVDAASTNPTAVPKPGPARRAFGMTPRMKLLCGVGFCGSFTTFSTFSVDVVNMIGRREVATAFRYLMVNNVGGIAAAAAGMFLAKSLFEV